MGSYADEVSILEQEEALQDDIPEHIRPLFLDSSSSVLPFKRERKEKKIKWLIDMVHGNPGEPLCDSAFLDPKVLASYGYNAKVVGEGKPPHVAITWDNFDPRIFPPGTPERAWVEETATNIHAEIVRIHEAGLKALYWFDICILPRRLVDLYAQHLFGGTPGTSVLSMTSTFLQQLLRITLDEVFATFPELDGLVIRTGEVYTMSTPYHAGFSVTKEGPQSHIQLCTLLCDEVAVKHDKLLFYRTWSFDKFHSDPAYYLKVSDAIKPHPNLTFIIKHTQVDFWRGVGFNPTLAVGNHFQLIEVQCQREYEGKGAFPNYIAKGVIEGFEELKPSNFASNNKNAVRIPIGAEGIIHDDRITGVMTWTRGGGWCGPYITNEFWIELNVFVITQWARNPQLSEKEIFDKFSKLKGLSDIHARKFRELALLSTRAVFKSQYLSEYPIVCKTWMRDHFLGGADCDLAGDFQRICKLGLKEEALLEKAEGQMLWERISGLSKQITFPDANLEEFFLHSIEYGRLLYSAIYHAWVITLEGVCGKPEGNINCELLREHICLYDEAWTAYKTLDGKIQDAPTLFLDRSFDWKPDERGMYRPHKTFGMGHSVNVWRSFVEEQDGAKI